jgi:hypothetical protein
MRHGILPPSYQITSIGSSMVIIKIPIQYFLAKWLIFVKTFQTCLKIICRIGNIKGGSILHKNNDTLVDA